MMLSLALCAAVVSTTSATAARAIVRAAAPGCAQAQHPCLPGVDAVGVGYDAVTGTSFGVGRPVIRMNYTAGNVWTDPFGNKTAYSYPDQATVMQKTDQTTKHSIYRSVGEYVSQQQKDAYADASYGMFFKASADTMWAKTTMSDSLHIVAESRCELGVYSITLDPPLFLEPDPQFLQFVGSLPAEYDAAAYAQLIRYYGTHYVAAGTLGGRGRMRTVISHDYYSTQSDSSISAQLHISWDLFGGGGGGGGSSHTHDQTWTSNANSFTHTEGGDPAISSFNSSAEWTAWAQSVETTSPVVTSVALEPVWSLIPVADPRRDNIMKAVAVYASNETWPAANLANYTMSWCDCYCPPTEGDCDGGRCLQTCKEGYFYTQLGESAIDSHEGYEIYWDSTRCCRPCFAAQN